MKVPGEILEMSLQEIKAQDDNSSFLNHEFFQVSSKSSSSRGSSIRSKLPDLSRQRQRESQETRCSELEFEIRTSSVSCLQSSKNLKHRVSFKEILDARLSTFKQKKSVSVISLLKNRKGSKFLQGLLTQLPTECIKYISSEVSFLT